MEFDRDDCWQSLVNIQATLELIKSAMETCWSSEQRRWLSPDHPPGKNIYDLTGQLDECLKDNKLRRVLTWIEFHLDNGPVRQRQFFRALADLRGHIRNIERGNPNDPFQWLRASIDAAAQNVASELENVAYYITELVRMVSGEYREQTAHSMEALIEPEDARILGIAQSDASTDEKLRAIYDIDYRVVAWKSPRWSKLLGVSDAMIRDTSWWKVDRKAEHEKQRREIE
jgi:hypothetical protein